MPSNLGFRQPSIAINIGHNGSRFFVSDVTGTSETNVDRIGDIGPATISWSIWNRTKMDIQVRIDGFRRSSISTCPVSGSDFPACEYESGKVTPGEAATPTGFILAVDFEELHDYDLKVRKWDTGGWDIVDPELQIDP